MKKLFMVAMIVLLALGFSPMGHSFAQGKVVRITLIDENGSGEDGSAQLTDLPTDSTKVELIMLNEPDGATQPAGISEGSCATIDPDVATSYPLESVTAAKSTSTVSVGLDELMAKKYSILVYKSASDKTIISCGNLPTAASSSTAPLTLDQSLSKLLDQAQELEGYVKKKEADGTKNAYTAYHTTFAGVEGDIKAKNAATQAALETAMNDVNDAVGEGNWDEAADNAEKLVQAVEAAQKSLAGSTSTTTAATAVPASTGSSALDSAFTELGNEAGDLVRETTNQDADGAQAAYDEFHTTFAANEDAIKAKNAASQSRIEDAMHAVSEAITAKNWTEASTAAKELQDVVGEEHDKVESSGSAPLPTTGAGDWLTLSVEIALGGLLMLMAGIAIRRPAAR